jgi:hypothetical protein
MLDIDLLGTTFKSSMPEREKAMFTALDATLISLVSEVFPPLLIIFM